MSLSSRGRRSFPPPSGPPRCGDRTVPLKQNTGSSVAREASSSQKSRESSFAAFAHPFRKAASGRRAALCCGTCAFGRFCVQRASDSPRNPLSRSGPSASFGCCALLKVSPGSKAAFSCCFYRARLQSFISSAATIIPNVKESGGKFLSRRICK